MMDKFLWHNDELGQLIQARAADLYTRLINLDAENLGMPDYCLSYYKSSHSTRLFFSIETSAQLLYKALHTSRKKTEDIVLMDYGAGVGTLFLLAKLIGCKKVIYNDHLEDWKKSAELIANAIGVHIDMYVVGDIEECLNSLDNAGIRCDIITSRNVIEHIYRLNDFYKLIYEKQPGALVFSSTTANKNNPASVVKHILWHRRWEKVFRGKRLAVIQQELTGMPISKMKMLAIATRGMATADLKHAIERYRKTGSVPDPGKHGTNTCDPSNGVWAEHLLSLKQYKQLIGENHYHISFEPGFWDTHYTRKYMNAVGKFFNKIIRKGGQNALRVAPFIYVIAKPRTR